MKYALRLTLTATAQDPSTLLDNVDQVTDEMAKLDAAHDSLLDFAIAADALTGEVTVEMTVESDSLEGAVACGVSCARAAIHAAGSGTPGWDDRPASDYVIAYTLGPTSTEPLVAA